MNHGQGRMRSLGMSLVVPLVLIAAMAVPAHASFHSLRVPLTIECQIRSRLAEAAGDHSNAIVWAESLAAIEPSSAYAKSRLARLYEDIGEDLTALDRGEQALALDSLNADAAMLVGRMRLRAGEPAAQVLTPPLRQLGAVPELYALRAVAHELDRNYEAALADLKRTGALLPDFAWVAIGILSLALEDGKLEEAYDALNLALELKPGDTRTLTLGVALARRMGNSIMEESLQRELALAPGAQQEEVANYGAFLIRARKDREFKMLLDWAEDRGVRPEDLRIGTGRALLHAGGYREAIAVVRSLKRDPMAIPIRARAYLALGDEVKALDGYRKLIQKSSLTCEESLAVAYLEIRVGDRKRGIQTLEEVRSRRTLDSPRRVLAASLCYTLLGHPEETVALVRESTARGLTSPSIYEELGTAATQLGDSLLAQWAWERLRESGWETSECLYFLGSAELARGEFDQAAQSLSRAVQLNPKNGKALLRLGTLRQRHGQLEMAREILIRASQCPETAGDANRALARVCRSLRLDSEAREAESRAKSGRSSPSAGLSFSPSR